MGRARRSGPGVVRPDNVLLELVIDQLGADGELCFAAPHREQIAVELEVDVPDRLVAGLDLPRVGQRGEYPGCRSAAER